MSTQQKTAECKFGSKTADFPRHSVFFLGGGVISESARFSFWEVTLFHPRAAVSRSSGQSLAVCNNRRSHRDATHWLAGFLMPMFTQNDTKPDKMDILAHWLIFFRSFFFFYQPKKKKGQMICRCESCVEVRHFLESQWKGNESNFHPAFFFLSLFPHHQAILFIHFITLLLFIYKLAARICLAAFIFIFAVVFTLSFFTHNAFASGCDSFLFFFFFKSHHCCLRCVKK